MLVKYVPFAGIVPVKSFGTTGTRYTSNSIGAMLDSAGVRYTAGSAGLHMPARKGDNHCVQR